MLEQGKHTKYCNRHTAKVFFHNLLHQWFKQFKECCVSITQQDSLGTPATIVNKIMIIIIKESLFVKITK